MSVRSGTVEPTWIAQTGAIVYEDVNFDAPPATVPTTDPVTTPPPSVIDRYAPPWRQLGQFLTNRAAQ